MRKIVCAISGGVDSAVAALLLKQKGFNVLGAFMRNWDLRDETGHCSSEEDFHYAQRVCSTLRIPFHDVNFVKEYWNDVFQETVEEYENGRTPNPDVLCNQHIKFNAFLKYANDKLNTTTIATGHYARTSENFSMHIDIHNGNADTERNNGSLYKALDENKDQTFFLHKISSSALKKTIFPVGGLFKNTVKAIAVKNDLEFVAKRKESMGICFIGLRDFESFIEDYIPPKIGNFISLETGEVVGAHNGYFKYTIGQRARLTGSHIPYFVAGKNIQNGDIYVAGGTNHPCLFSNSFIIDIPHWINNVFSRCFDKDLPHLQVRLMHREPVVNCKIYRLLDSNCLIIIQQPLRAITAGQSAVLYSGHECLGGSKVLHVGPSVHEFSDGTLNFAPFRSDSGLWSAIYEEYGNQIISGKPNIMNDIHTYQNMLKNYHQ